MDRQTAAFTISPHRYRGGIKKIMEECVHRSRMVQNSAKVNRSENKHRTRMVQNSAKVNRSENKHRTRMVQNSAKVNRFENEPDMEFL